MCRICSCQVLNWKDVGQQSTVYSKATPVIERPAEHVNTPRTESSAATSLLPTGNDAAPPEDGRTTLINDTHTLSVTDSASITGSAKFDEVSTPSNNNVSGPPVSTTGIIERKTKNTNRTERNTKVILAKEIPGNRGDHDLDHLVSYIENDKDQDDRIRKLVTKRHAGNKKVTNKEGNAKIKKSNSMDDLKSRSKIEQEDVQSKAKAKSDANVKTTKSNTVQSVSETGPCRNKQQTVGASAKKAASSNSGDNSTTKDTNKPQHQKRCERRSWGTEELASLNEIVASSSKSEKHVVAAASSVPLKTNRAPKEFINVARFVSESDAISCLVFDAVTVSHTEMDEFHMVTKKKKLKKRAATLEGTIFQQPSGGAFNASNPNRRYDTTAMGNTNIRGKYHDRDAYTHSDYPQPATIMHQIQPIYQHPPCHHSHESNRANKKNNNRRKSASSVPPSEKSDSSDRESVISLPIESTIRVTPTSTQPKASRAKNTSTISSTPNELVTAFPEPTQTSYADIARISNPVEKIPVATTISKPSGTSSSILSPDHLDEWPAVSANKSPASPEQPSDLNSSASPKSTVNSVILNVKSAADNMPKHEPIIAKKQTPPPTTTTTSKRDSPSSNINRPPVVIKSDRRRRDTNSADDDQPRSPPLLFGDFNEEVLRLLEPETELTSSAALTPPQISMPALNTKKSTTAPTVVTAECHTTPAPCTHVLDARSSAAAQSHVDALAKQSTMSFLGNAIDMDQLSTTSHTAHSTTVRTVPLGKKAKREAAKLAKADLAASATVQKILGE